VIVYLPENRHLVIDSKVNLTAYEKYYNSEDGPVRDAALKEHIAAFLRHIDELDVKRYQDHYKLTSLDFVLMFVPVEPAFTLAVQTDPSIYGYAFERNVVIVTPSTLHATMHTIANIWRQENQNRNAMEIAKKSGDLYDKFVGFVQDLEDIGVKIAATQKTYDNAHKKLTSGRGNLVNRVETIRELGAKAQKKLPQHLLAAAEDITLGDLVEVNSACEVN
jgi:DNA recombination protein RmuC